MNSARTPRTLAAILVFLIGGGALVAFGGVFTDSPIPAYAAQYKPPPPPTTVLSGLSQPIELAADFGGNLWFTQGGVPSTNVKLYVLGKGTSTPVEVYTASGGNGSETPFLIDIAFDASSNPHFTQFTGTGSSVDTKIVRVDAVTGAPTILASASGTQTNLNLTSGSWLDESEVGSDGTVYFTKQTVAASGSKEASLLALAPGATTPTVLTQFATPGVDHAIGAFVVAADGTIYFVAGASVPGGPPSAGSQGAYRLPPGGSPEPLRVFPGQNPAAGPRLTHVGLDGAGNLIVGERVVNGFHNQGCAASTTYRLVRFDAASLAGPTPVGTVYSSATYPEFNFVFVGGSSYFRVSADGTVLVGLYASSSRCSNPSAPITFTHLRMIGVDGKDPGGTQHVIFDDAPSPPTVSGGYSFAFSGNEAFATSARLGTLSSIDLNKSAKKPK